MVMCFGGYRLWKFMVFMQGFLIVGTCVAVIVFVNSAEGCFANAAVGRRALQESGTCACMCCAGNLCTADNVGFAKSQYDCGTQYPAPCNTCKGNGGSGMCAANCGGGDGDGSSITGCDSVAIETLAAFVIAGLIGGMLFICLYFLVIFCMGFGCGVGSFWYLSLFVLAHAVVTCVQTSTASSSTCHCSYSMSSDSSVADSGVQCMDALQADSMQHLAYNTMVIIGGISVLVGLIMGIVFVKIQKAMIIFGTSYIGSGMVGVAIFQCFQHETFSSTQTVLLVVGTVAGCMIQYHVTGKNVDMDPATGQIVVRHADGDSHEGLFGGGAASDNRGPRLTTTARVRTMLGMTPVANMPIEQPLTPVYTTGGAEKTLYAFLAVLSLEDYEEALAQFGANTPTDLKELSVSDLETNIGMKPEEVTELHKALAKI
jgi:hypothetical protein